MTLVKLDSGDYINTEAVDVINDGDNPYVGLRSNNSFDITESDRYRIVAEMKSEQKLHNLKMMALQRGLIV